MTTVFSIKDCPSSSMFNRIGSVMVSCSSRVCLIVGSSRGQVKPNIIKLVFTDSTKHTELRSK